MNIIVTKRSEIVAIPDYSNIIEQILLNLKDPDYNQYFVYHLGITAPYIAAMYASSNDVQDIIEKMLVSVKNHVFIPSHGCYSQETRVFLKDLYNFGSDRAKLHSTNGVEDVLIWFANNLHNDELIIHLNIIMMEPSEHHIEHIDALAGRKDDLRELIKLLELEQTETLRITAKMLKSLLEFLNKGGMNNFKASDESINNEDIYWLFVTIINETLDYWAYVYTHSRDPLMLKAITNIYHPFVISQYDGSTFNFSNIIEKTKASSYVMSKIRTPYLFMRDSTSALKPMVFKTGVSVIMGKAGDGKNLMLSHLFNSLVSRLYQPNQYSSELDKLKETDICIMSMKERSEFIFDSTPGNMSHEIQILVQDDIINFHDLIKRISLSDQRFIFINSILPFIREVEMNHKGGTQAYGIKSGPIDDVLSTLNTVGQLFGKVIICTYRPGDDNQLDALIQPITGQAWLGIILKQDGTIIVDRTGSTGQLLTNCPPIKQILISSDQRERLLGKYQLIPNDEELDPFSANYEDEDKFFNNNIHNQIMF